LWRSHPVVVIFFRSKKEQLDSLQILEIELLVENLLKKLNILPLQSQYIFSILLFVKEPESI